MGVGEWYFYNNGSCGNCLSGITPIAEFADQSSASWFAKVAGKVAYESGQIKIYDGYYNGFVQILQDLRGKTAICVDFLANCRSTREYNIGITPKKVNSFLDRDNGDAASFERKIYGSKSFNNNNTRSTATIHARGGGHK